MYSIRIFILGLLFSVQLAAQPYPPQDQWDQVLSFYGNQGIPAEYVNKWRPYTTARSVRENGMIVLPEVPLNPFPGVYLNPDLAALGKISVIDFGADPTGVLDSTEAIQRAVDFGRDYAMVTFFPEGTYTVSGTIKAWSLTRIGPEFENGRVNREDFFVPVLVGSAAGARRPVIRLAPGSFPTYVEEDRRFVVEFRNFIPPDNRTFIDENGQTRFAYELAPERLAATERERLRENTPDHIGPEFRGIDIEIAPNNAGASGLRFPTAETSGIGDIEIRFLGAGHVGLQGPPGGGSSSVNITIIGGRIGLDTTGQNEANHTFPAVPNSRTGAQPTPVLTGLRLINQTELAVRSQVRGTLVGVGWHIETQRNGPVIMLRHSWYGDPFSSSLALIDSTIIYNTAMPFGNIVIGRYGDVEDRNRSFYLDNVYVKNAQALYVANNLPAETFAANPVGWYHAKRLGYERRPAPRSGYDLFERVWQNGQLHDTWILRGYSMAAHEQPPVDLISRHLYQEPFPHFEVPGAVNIRDHGAVGDMLADDTAAIRAAIAAAAANGSNVVVVPRGYFRVSDTIDLLPETKLIGINRQWSGIASSQAAGVFGGAASRTDYPEGIPLIRTVDSANADTVIAHLRLAVGFPIKAHNGWWTGGAVPNYTQPGAIPPAEAVVEVYPLQWRAGGTSIVRECMFNPRNEFNFHFNMYNEETYAGAVFLHPLIRIEGNGGGRWYGFHFHGYFPFGPEGELIRITDNQNPVHFYHLHAQHNTALNLIRLENARYVSIYGVKTEHHKTLLRSQNSKHLRIFGHGGIATPAPGGQHYYFDNNPDFLIAAVGDEIRFAGNTSIGSGWSIMYFTNFENYKLFIDRQGGVEFSPPFNERPILYQRGNPQSGIPNVALTTHEITFSSVQNGSVSGQLAQVVASGANTGSVTAVPDPGYSFAGWSGDYVGTRNPLYLRDVQGALHVTAHFQPASTPPEVTILRPVQSAVLFVDETITLQGTAIDPLDGDISATAQWSSNRDGQLGVGGVVLLSELSPGLHQLSLTATNSNQQTVTAQRLVWVQSGAIVVPDTTGTNPASNTPWLPVRVKADNLGYSGLVRGSGLTAQSGNDVFRVRQGAPEQGADLAFVLANNHFIAFTITPDPEHPLNLEGATFTFAVSRQNSAAARNFTVFTSVHGFTEGQEVGTQVHSLAPTEFATLSYTLTGAAFASLTAPIEVRIYPHNASWGRDLSFRDIALFRAPSMDLNPDPEPEPEPNPVIDIAQPENVGGGTGATYFLDVQTGSDSNSGLSEAQAWQSFQHAIDSLQPGDTVLIREGDYFSTGNDEYKNWNITRAGAPGQYITFRAYPGERPRFHVDTWNGIQLWEVAYVELDGLEVIGLPDPEWLAAEADNSQARKDLAQDRRYFGGGITITHGGVEPHHLRIRNNVVHSVGGNGISFRGGNLFLVEGNTVYNTSHRSDAGNSAISFVELNAAQHQSAGYGVVVRNNVLHNNRNRVAFKWVGYITDGNGVIIDYCQNYNGDRILIANNLAFHNGGRAFHVYYGRNVDIIHNTAFHNLQSQDLQWAGELSSDAPSGFNNHSIRFFNNIAVAGPDRRAYHVANTTDWEFTHNLVSSSRAPAHSVDTVLNLLNQDPMFVDVVNEDFRLRSGSPALDVGQAFAFVVSDITGADRTQGGAPDLGAFEGAFNLGMEPEPDPDPDPEPVVYTVFNGGAQDESLGWEGNWSQGFPGTTNVGGIQRNALWNWRMNNLVQNWRVIHAAGSLYLSGTNAQLTGTSDWRMDGGILAAGTEHDLRVEGDARFTLNGGSVSVHGMRVTGSGSAMIQNGGTVTVATDIIGGSFGSTITMNGGTLTTGSINLNSTVLQLNGGQLSLLNLQHNLTRVTLGGAATISIGSSSGVPLTRFNFNNHWLASAHHATLTIAGWGYSEFEALFTSGRIHYDQQVLTAAQFAATFQVHGSTLSHISNTGPQLSAFESWMELNGMQGGAEASSGGITHLQRYAFGGNAQTPLDELLPTIDASPDGNGGLNFTVSFNRIDDPLIRYSIWFSTDLEDWGHSPVWSQTGAGEPTIQISVPGTMRGFLRVSVTHD